MAENTDLDKVYKYHPPTEDQKKRYELIRNVAMGFADLVIRECPSSRERSTALTHLEAAVMWANASIARNENKVEDPEEKR